MNMTEMESKLRELRSLQRLIEEAEQEVEAIKDGIKAQLTAQGGGRASGRGVPGELETGKHHPH